jgi:nicotinamide-nucleotide amidase
MIVGDDRGDLARAIHQALDISDIVVLTGGLGPTEDDVTREAVSDALGMPLEEDPDVVERIRRRFEARNLDMPANNRRQAMVPRGAERLDNRNGTAPGFWIERAGRSVLVLPGPPREMEPMLSAVVSARLAPLTAGIRLYRRVLKITGLGESHVDQAAERAYGAWAMETPPIRTTILAARGQIELHLSMRHESADAAAARLDRATAVLQEMLAPAVYSIDGRTLEEVVGQQLRDHRLRIAAAESCTGGLLLSRLTDVPGSSDYVERGVVCYSNAAKVELLGVPEGLLREHGAVSEPVALAMASGMRERARVDLGVAVTGIAGPAGGSDRKPVGTVVIALAWAGGERVRRFQFVAGSRELVKYQASQAALDMVRRWIEESGDAAVPRG